MSETGEMPSPQEIQTESPMTKKVKKAMDNAWEGAKETNREYWEIRKAMQERLDWHGGGTYKHYVESMDKITNFVWGSGDPSLINSSIATIEKGWTRFSGAFMSAGAAGADIAWNAISWPFRMFLPIPKDIVKRSLVWYTNTRLISLGAVAGTVGAEKAVNKGVKALGEAAITAPEVAVVMAKRRAEKAVYNILHPNQNKPSVKNT